MVATLDGRRGRRGNEYTTRRAGPMYVPNSSESITRGLGHAVGSRSASAYVRDSVRHHRASFRTTRRGDRLSRNLPSSGARLRELLREEAPGAPKGGRGEVSRSSANVQLSLVRHHIVRYYRVSCVISGGTRGPRSGPRVEERECGLSQRELFAASA